MQKANNIYGSEPNLNANLQFDSDQDKKYTPLYSSPSFNSLWNLSDNDLDDDTASVTTILRCQRRDHSIERLTPNSVARPTTPIYRSLTPLKKDTKVIYSRIYPVKNFFDQQSNPKAPPLPPKKFFLRRINSQPNAIYEHKITEDRTEPPRPTAKKPFWLQHSRPVQTQYNAYSMPNVNPRHHIPYKQQQSCLSESRSASSNEIFKLYQTRDCLGNILFEL